MNFINRDLVSKLVTTLDFFIEKALEEQVLNSQQAATLRTESTFRESSIKMPTNIQLQQELLDLVHDPCCF